MPDACQIRKTSLPIEVERRLSVHNPVRDSHHTSPALLSGSALPTEASPVPVGNSTAAPSAQGTLPFGAAGSLAPSGDVFSAFASLSKSLSPHQLQEFLHSLQTPGHGDLRSQVGPLCLYLHGWVIFAMHMPVPWWKDGLLSVTCMCVCRVCMCHCICMVLLSAQDSSSYNSCVLI